MKIVVCRSCGTHKAAGDPCNGCGRGLVQATLKIRRNRPTALTKEHGIHAPMLVPMKTARALVRF